MWAFPLLTVLVQLVVRQPTFVHVCPTVGTSELWFDEHGHCHAGTMWIAECNNTGTVGPPETAPFIGAVWQNGELTCGYALSWSGGVPGDMQVTRLGKTSRLGKWSKVAGEPSAYVCEALADRPSECPFYQAGRITTP